MPSFETYKFLHLLAVAIFLGNMVAGVFWKVCAERRKIAVVMATAQRTLLLSDFCIALPAAATLYFSGRMAAASQNLNLGSTPWIHWSILLFAASGIPWILLMIPLQLKQLKMVTNLSPSEEIPKTYWVYSRLWFVSAFTAKLLPIIALYFMVAKKVF